LLKSLAIELTWSCSKFLSVMSETPIFSCD
jgi:hypothetical protein